MSDDYEDFEPFGDEWKSEIMKWRKADLIEFLCRNLHEKKELKRVCANFIKHQKAENLSILESVLTEINYYD